MKIKKEIILKDGTKAIFRDPKISDAKQLLNHLYVCASETDFLLAYAPDIKKRTIESEKDWVRNFNNSDNLLIVVEIDGQIVGLSEVSFMKAHKTCHRGSIGISVQKKYWNKGLGGYMFDELISYAKAHGCEQVELGVIEANDRARHLYEKKGFEYTGKYPRAIKLDDGTYYDELLMTKML